MVATPPGGVGGAWWCAAPPCEISPPSTAPDADAATPAPTPAPTPPPRNLTLFVTNASVSVASLGGVAGADAACTAQSPGGVPSKALIADEAGCSGSPCRQATIGSQIDWALLPNTPYWNHDETRLIATTTADAVLPNPLDGVIQTVSNFNQASGMNNDWTTKVGFTCDSWRNGTSSFSAGVGWLCTDPGTCLNTDQVLVGGSGDCGGSARFLCATV